MKIKKIKLRCLVLLMLTFFFAADGAAVSEYDPLGIRAGAFIIKPELNLGMEYTDNVYATEKAERSDWITTLAPKIEVSSDWARHFLGINVGLESGIYSTESDENYVDGHIKLDSRLDFLRESFLTGQAGFERVHEARGEPDSDQAWSEPATYYRSSLSTAYYHGRGKLSAMVGGGIVRLDYLDVDLNSGGSQNLDFRDYNIYNVNARLAYEIHPVMKPFFSTRYEWRQYDKSEAERDSRGYRVALGTGFDLGGVTSGEIFAGYLRQEYDQFGDNKGPWYGMTLKWNATAMTSLEGSVVKSIKETTASDSSGIDGLDTKLRVDHELLRNLLLGAFFDYTHNSYKDIDITDRYYKFGPTLTYLWNRNLSAEIAYKSNSCDSNLDDREFTENRFSFSIAGKF